MECVNDKVAKPQMNDGPFSSQKWNKGGSPNLLQHLKLQKENEVAQSRLTLCNPMDCSLLGSSVHGIFQARVLERVAKNCRNFCQRSIISKKNLLHPSFDLNSYPASRFSHHYFRPGDCDSLKDCLATWLQDVCTALCNPSNYQAEVSKNFLNLVCGSHSTHQQIHNKKGLQSTT